MPSETHLLTHLGVAFEDIGVWIGIKCVKIAFLGQARPLCRDSGHTSCGGHKIKRADVLPQSPGLKAGHT